MDPAEPKARTAQAARAVQSARSAWRWPSRHRLAAEAAAFVQPTPRRRSRSSRTAQASFVSWRACEDLLRRCEGIIASSSSIPDHHTMKHESRNVRLIFVVENSTPGWTFLTNHAQVLVCIASIPACACAISASMSGSPSGPRTGSSRTSPPPGTSRASETVAATTTRSTLSSRFLTRSCASRTSGAARDPDRDPWVRAGARSHGTRWDQPTRELRLALVWGGLSGPRAR